MTTTDPFPLSAPATPESFGARAAREILAHRDELIDCLTEIATYRSAADEVGRAVRALAGADWELLRNRPHPVRQISTFLPSNNVLYSYVLFAVIPSGYCERVVVRPSMRVASTVRRLHALICELGIDLGRIELAELSQRRFLQLCRTSDVVVFTGQYANSLEVADALPPECLLLTLGSGPNPFVIGPTADLNRAAEDLALARLYNSGQDCLCPDVVFVHRSRKGALLEALEARLRPIGVADRRLPTTVVAPLVYGDAYDEAERFVTAHRGATRYGGQLDPASQSVAPTIVELEWSDDFDPPEFFAPIFCIVPYERAAQVQEWLTTPTALRRGMYASVYGEPELAGPVIGTTVVCYDETTFDIEDGNRPFGGHGICAGNVRHGGQVAARPLLLSRELRSVLAGRS